MLNALTVDVEDYFQVTAFAKVIDRGKWSSYPLRVVENTKKALDLLEIFQIKGTFFVLGWIAEKAPGLVKEIADRGHEIGSHGYGHELVYEIGPERFREDIRRSKSFLESLTGSPVLGYRAPSYSITKKSEWALDILIEEGFAYDSSIFPIHHDIYGMPDSQRFPHVIERGAGKITEFPLTTLPLNALGKTMRLPIAGGGYLRLFPVRFIETALRKINQLENQPAVLYFHPWELDPGQPRMKASFKSTFRHYINLSRTEKKLRVLLSRLSFCSMGEVLDSVRSLSPVAEGSTVFKPSLATK